MIPGNTSSQGKYVDPPTSVSATAGNGQATVSFTLPVYDGKGTATFVATSSPGGFTASGSSSPLTVTGLSNGTAYTFTVTTISGYGVSTVSSASTSVTPVTPPVTPPVAPVTPPVDPCAGSPAYFTLIGYNCQGYTYQTVRSDGCYGQFANAPESVPNSTLCGYPAPVAPAPVAPAPVAPAPVGPVSPCAGSVGYYNSGIKCYPGAGNCFQVWYRTAQCGTSYQYCDGPGC